MLGTSPQTNITTDIEYHLEELDILGYTIVENFIDNEIVQTLRDKILELWQANIAQYSKEKLLESNEYNFIRAPMSHDLLFLTIFNTPLFKEIMAYALQYSYPIVNVQNAIINTKKSERFTSQYTHSFHRDFYYFHAVSSSPLVINALLCLDDFSEQNGGTQFIPFSHKKEKFPSSQYMSKHVKTLTTQKGSLLLMNSQIIHRAGINSSAHHRIALNTVFSHPRLRPQFDFPNIIPKTNDQYLNQLLGHQNRTPQTIDQFVQSRMKQ